MYRDQWLPLTEPEYARFDITAQPDGSRTLRVYWADGPGFVSAKDSELYEDLTMGETADVVMAVLDRWSGFRT